jgi:hypothetical protein
MALQLTLTPEQYEAIARHSPRYKAAYWADWDNWVPAHPQANDLAVIDEALTADLLATGMSPADVSEQVSIMRIVGSAPRMTPEQRDTIRRVFRYGPAPEKRQASAAHCYYCGKQLDIRRGAYVMACEVPDWDPQAMKENTLFCGIGCGRAAQTGGVTKAAASNRPPGWS